MATEDRSITQTQIDAITSLLETSEITKLVENVSNLLSGKEKDSKMYTDQSWKNYSESMTNLELYLMGESYDAEELSNLYQNVILSYESLKLKEIYNDEDELINDNDELLKNEDEIVNNEAELPSTGVQSAYLEGGLALIVSGLLLIFRKRLSK